MSEHAEAAARFERIASRLVRGGRAEHGTMMGYPCLRAQGRFVAALEAKSGRLIVKLPTERVRALVDGGSGVAFAPNGRVFREWIGVDPDRGAQWTGLIEEALACARHDEERATRTGAAHT